MSEAIPDNGYVVALETRIALLEADATAGPDYSQMAAIVRQVTDPTLSQIASDLDQLHKMLRAQMEELTSLRKMYQQKQPDILACITGAVEPVIDTLLDLERSTEDRFERVKATTGTSVEAAKNAASFAVQNAALNLLATARDFAFRE